MGLGRVIQRRGFGRGIGGRYGAYGFGDFGGFGGALGDDEDRFDLRFLETVSRLPVIWSCVRVRAGRLSAAEVTDANGKVPRFMQASGTVAGNGYLQELGLPDYLGQTAVSYDLAGNAFIGVIRSRRGIIGESMVLDPQYITVDLDSQRGKYRIYFDGWQGEIWIVPNMMLPAYPIGLPIIEYQRLVLRQSRVGHRHAASILENSSVIPGVLSDEGNATPEQIKQIQRNWRRAHAGPDRTGLPAYIGQGKFTPIAVTPKDGQLLEGRQFTDTQICALLGVDPTLVGLPSPGKSLTYQTLASREQALGVELMPLKRRLEDLYTRLNNGKKVTLRLQDHVSDETRSAIHERYARVAAAAGSAVTVNEVRHWLGLEPFDGPEGDEMFKGSADVDPMADGQTADMAAKLDSIQAQVEVGNE